MIFNQKERQNKVTLKKKKVWGAYVCYEHVFFNFYLADNLEIL